MIWCASGGSRGGAQRRIPEWCSCGLAHEGTLLSSKSDKWRHAGPTRLKSMKVTNNQTRNSSSRNRLLRADRAYCQKRTKTRCESLRSLAGFMKPPGSRQKAASRLNWVLELVKSNLQHGEQVSIAKFGVFTVRTKFLAKAEPRTGKELMIPQCPCNVALAASHHSDVTGIFIGDDGHDCCGISSTIALFFMN